MVIAWPDWEEVGPDDLPWSLPTFIALWFPDSRTPLVVQLHNERPSLIKTNSHSLIQTPHVYTKYPFEWTRPGRTWWTLKEETKERHRTALPNVTEEAKSRNGENSPCTSQIKEGNGSFESLHQGRSRNIISEEDRYPEAALCNVTIIP